MGAVETTNKARLRAFRAALASGDEAVPYVLHRILGYPFFLVAIKMGIKANYLTMLSLGFNIAAAGLFLVDQYVWRAVAGVLLNLGLAVDTIDGAVARHRNEVSEFGAWLSAQGSVLKTVAIWSCVAIGVYLATEEPLPLILGIVAVGHFSLSYHLMRTNKTYTFYRYRNGALGLTRTGRLGFESSWIMLLSVFALVDQLNLLLIVFSGLGAVPWVVLIIRAVQSHLHQERDTDA